MHARLVQRTRSRNCQHIAHNFLCVIDDEYLAHLTRCFAHTSSACDRHRVLTSAGGSGAGALVAVTAPSRPVLTRTGTFPKKGSGERIDQAASGAGSGWRGAGWGVADVGGSAGAARAGGGVPDAAGGAEGVIGFCGQGGQAH